MGAPGHFIMSSPAPTKTTPCIVNLTLRVAHKVFKANETTYVTLILLLLAWLLNVTFTVEQPMSSVMFDVEHLAMLLQFTGATYETIWLGAYGGLSPKPLKLYGSCTWLGSLYRPKPKKGLCTVSLVTRKGTKVSGNKRALKASQIYTEAFGIAVATAFIGQ